jgi:hypothetical protein
MENQNINDILLDENVKKVATEILSSFNEDNRENSIDHDFSLKNGKMISKESNTFFTFTPKKDTLLNLIAQKIRDIEITEKLTKEVKTFEDKVKKYINDNMSYFFAQKIRDVILKANSNTGPVPISVLFPLKTIKVISFELNMSFDPEKDGGYTITIQKQVPKGTKYVPSKSVANDMIQTRLSTEKDYDQIIKEKKEAGDIDYKYITGYYKKYYEEEYSLSLYVDYSPIPQNELVEYIKNSTKSS